MLSFNQKVDSILDPRRRFAASTVFDDLFLPQQIPKLNVGPSNLMACSHQECELRFPRMTVMDHRKPLGGIKYLLENSTCLISDHAGKKLKVDKDSSSDCGMDEQGTCHYFANPNQEPLGGGGGNHFNLSENSDKGQTIGGASQNQKSRTRAGHVQYVSKSSAGVASSLMQKDNGCAERANELLATLSV